MRTKKSCGLRFLPGMFVAFFVISCSSGQDVTLGVGETSTANPTGIAVTTLVVGGNGARIGDGVVRDESILQNFRGSGNIAPGDDAGVDDKAGSAGHGTFLQREYFRQRSIDEVGAAYAYSWTWRGGLSELLGNLSHWRRCQGCRV